MRRDATSAIRISSSRHELCISCGRCVRACDELQGAFALTATGRGFDANVAAGLDAGFLESACTSCGACADTCPTEAIAERSLLALAGEGSRCRLTAASTRRSPRPAATAASAAASRCTPAAGTSSRSAPPATAPRTAGHACVKGRFAHQFTRSPDRLTAPLVRAGDGFEAVSWDEALDRVAGELLRIKAEHGPDAIAGLASSRATNEECYAMQRVFRAAIGTHNIDNCSRVCHSPTSFALRRSLGLSGASGSFDDIERAQVILLVGANPTAGHPVVGARMKQAALNGTKL